MFKTRQPSMFAGSGDAAKGVAEDDQQHKDRARYRSLAFSNCPIMPRIIVLQNVGNRGLGSKRSSHPFERVS